ncbi:MAG: TIR domain-containing protein [Candidatus Nitrotoga sp.]|nr:TIR domain-containing protein [Candidatus Nitrotoga sp.]
MSEKLHGAFISYSRKDKVFASLVEKALENYTPPKSSAISQKRLDIFRDEEDFTGTDYHKAVNKHLQESRKLILICSPAARASRYVNDEVRIFAEANGSDNIIPILLGGIPNNEASSEQDVEKAFPDTLVEIIQMPLAISYIGFQPNKDKVNKGKYDGSWFSLLANLYDIGRGEIEQRERKRQAHIRNLWIIGLGSAVVILSVFLGLAVFNWLEAEQARDLEHQATKTAELNELIAKAETELINNPQLSLLMSISAVSQAYSEMPIRHSEVHVHQLTANKSLGLRAENVLHKAVQAYRTQYVFEPNIKGIWSVSFSPDGMYMAAGGVEGTVKLWRVSDSDLLKWEEFGSLQHAKEVRSIAFSHDSKYLATASYDNIVRLWNIQTRESKDFVGHSGKVRAIAFSPDGQWLASGGEDNTLIIWDIDTQKSIRRFTDHTAKIWGVSFSPDGKILATASSDKTARIWNLENIKQDIKPRVLKHNDKVTGVSFSPDGELLATSSSDSTVRIWSASKNHIYTVLAEHASSIWAITFSPDGRLLATTSNDGETKVWERKRNLDTYEKNKEQNSDVLHDGGIDSFTPLFNFVSQGRGVGVAFGYDKFKRILAIASDDGTVRLWNMEPRLELLALEGHHDQVWDVAFTIDGNHLVTVSEDRAIKFWDAITGIEEYTSNHTAPIRALSQDRIGNKLATSSTDGLATIGDISINSINKIQSVQGNKDRGVGVALSPDGEIIATSLDDNSVVLWNVESGQPLKVFKEHTGFVYGLAFNHKGNLLATASDDKTIKIWSINSDKSYKNFPPSHTAPVRTVTFDPEDKLIASAGADGLIKVWSINDGKELWTLEGHTGEIHKLSFSNNGKRIASAGHDGTVRIWNADTGNLELTLTYPGSALSLNFSPDGNRIAVAGTNKVVQIYTINTKELVDLAIDRLSQTNDPSLKEECRKYLTETVCNLIR